MECWKIGMLILKGIFFEAHYSIFPVFQYSIWLSPQTQTMKEYLLNPAHPVKKVVEKYHE
jgi:hypothetical protein